MRALSVLLAVAASLVASVCAQGPLAFTSTPNTVTAGKPFNITWAGGDGSDVTVTLKKGDKDNLQTITVLTGSDTSGYYVWTPSKSLANGDDYALSISQGQDTINYSGEFALTGGTDVQATIVIGGSTTYSLTPSASASLTSTATSTATVTAANLSTSSSVSLSVVTITTTTGPVPLLTGTAPAGASGTGASVSRNHTFSSATLSGTAKSTSSGSATGSGSGTATSSGPAAASSTGAAAAVAVVQGAAWGGIGALVALMAMF